MGKEESKAFNINEYILYMFFYSFITLCRIILN